MGKVIILCSLLVEQDPEYVNLNLVLTSLFTNTLIKRLT